LPGHLRIPALASHRRKVELSGGASLVYSPAYDGSSIDGFSKHSRFLNSFETAWPKWIGKIALYGQRVDCTPGEQLRK